jgi:hypothetical protein
VSVTTINTTDGNAAEPRGDAVDRVAFRLTGDSATTLTLPLTMLACSGIIIPRSEMPIIVFAVEDAGPSRSTAPTLPSSAASHLPGGFVGRNLNLDFSAAAFFVATTAASVTAAACRDDGVGGGDAAGSSSWFPETEIARAAAAAGDRLWRRGRGGGKWRRRLEERALAVAVVVFGPSCYFVGIILVLVRVRPRSSLAGGVLPASSSSSSPPPPFLDVDDDEEEY